MYHGRTGENFVRSLPAGGTLESTMEKRLITAGGKIHAKSGTMSGISTLSGYAFSPRYGPVAFSILMNGFIGSPIPSQDLQSKICEWLVRD
jgi:D-alanyl-D-alanine carboxypeptidase/D-alanyl-D-alanine-endopeptidase (penicillin-binding protein 4)